MLSIPLIDNRIIPSVFDKISVYAYKFFISYVYLAIKGAFAAWAFIQDQPLILLKVMVLVIALELLLSRDIMPMLCTLFMLALTMMAQYGAFIDDYIQIWPYVVPAVVVIIFRFFVYRTTFTTDKLLWCTIAVAGAILISGVGNYGIKDFVQPVLLYYYFGLSLGAILAYVALRNYIYSDSVYRPSVALTRTMIILGLVAAVTIAEHVIPFIIENKPWGIQWSNNFSTYLILAIPFFFYMALRQKHGIIYLLGGVFCYGAILMTLSRGGMVFGTLTFGISVIYALIYAKGINRITIIVLIAALIGGVIFLLTKQSIRDFIQRCLEINPGEARMNMYALAIDNFIANPLFGTGVFYKGDFYNPAKGAMYWYHSTPFQIIGMTGMVGIIAYSYQYYMRFKVILQRKNLFNYAVLLAFIGFETMSFVNPGDFVPVPFMIIIFAMLVCCEVTRGDECTKVEAIRGNRETTQRLFRG